MIHQNTVEEGWKLVTSRPRRKALPSPEDLALSALQAEEELGKTLGEAARPTGPAPCGNAQRKRWVIVVGDSMLQAVDIRIYMDIWVYHIWIYDISMFGYEVFWKD